MHKSASTLVALLVTLLAGCDPRPPEAPPGYQGIVEYEERTLSFELPGHLESLAVDEGVVLGPGDEIARLDDTLETLARDTAQAQAHAARTRVTLLEAGTRKEDIDALKAGLTGAKSSEKLASRTFERERGLAAKGINRAADVDAASTALSNARAQRQELEQQLARARHGARPEEVDVVVAEAEAAEAAVKAYDERIARHVLHSEHVGYVLEVHHEEGEFVGVGSPLITMADLARPYIDVFVPQGSIGEAKLGAAATLRVDATQQTFAGKVEMVGRQTEFTPKFLFSDSERANLVIRVRIRVDDPEHELRAGLPGFVTLEPGAGS